MDNHKHLRRLTMDAMFLGAALMLAFAEALLPPLPFPGVKLGLANLATLCCAYAVGLTDAALTALARWLLSGLLFGSGTSLLFSLSGTVCVLAVLLVLRITGTGRLSFVGISVLTAAGHNLGQLLCAALLYGWGTGILRGYGALLLFAGTLCGVLSGWLCNLLFRRMGELLKPER